MLLGSVRSNLTLGFDSSSKNQTRFWSKLVPFLSCFGRKSKQIGVLLGSVWSNLTFDFDSGSKNQTRLNAFLWTYSVLFPVTPIPLDHEDKANL